MSVIIHGMEMPRTCIQCPCHFGGYCDVAPADVDDPQVAKGPFDVEGRAEWCPMEEQKSGKFILFPHEPKLAKCSACGAILTIHGPDKTGKGLIFKAIYKYCPNCGVKMDGGETDVAND